MTAERKGRFVLSLAALLGALTVLLGAFGAHGLKSVLNAAQMALYQTAVQYQFVHVLALLATGVLLRLSTLSEPARRLMLRAAWIFLFGLLLFCGSLYALSLTGLKGLGMVTPIGGVLFVVGWLLLAYGASQG